LDALAGRKSACILWLDVYYEEGARRKKESFCSFEAFKGI
jgi:hypothetical protein